MTRTAKSIVRHKARLYNSSGLIFKLSRVVRRKHKAYRGDLINPHSGETLTAYYGITNRAALSRWKRTPMPQFKSEYTIAWV